MTYNPRDLGLTTGRMSGQEVMVVCPYHDDHNPSATFNVRTGLFYCFTCNKGANISQLSAHLGVPEPMWSTSGFVPSMHVNGEDINWFVKWSHARLASPDSYLDSRGVSNFAVGLFDIRHDAEGVMFPIKRRPGDHPIGMQIRYYDGPTRYRTFGTKLPLWPFQLWPPQRSLTRYVITEGVFGTLRCREFGINAFATMGASVSKAGWGALAPFGRSMVVFFDGDRAGRKRALEIARKTGAKVVWPGGPVDEMDESEIRTALETALPIHEIMRRRHGEDEGEPL